MLVVVGCCKLVRDENAKRILGSVVTAAKVEVENKI